MDLGKNLVNLAFAPVRAGVAAAEASLDIAGNVFGQARRTADQVGQQAAPVVLHPYSMGHAREWPEAHWRALAERAARQNELNQYVARYGYRT